VLVVFTGGAASPLLFVFVLHVIFAAVLLDGRLAWTFAAVAVLGSVFVAVGEASGLLPVQHVVYDGVTVDLAGHPGQVVLSLLFFGFTVVVTAGATTAITSRLRAENTRRLEALQALAEERSRLMLHAAHNLRSPLTASMSILDVVAGEYVGLVTDEQKQYLARVRRRLAGLNDLIGELLMLARSRDAVGADPLAPVDLAELTTDVAATFAEQAAGSGVVLSVDVPPDVVPIVGDADQLRRLLENLVSNAVKYTRRGGRVDVTLSRLDSAAVQLVVRDTGIGVPAAEQEGLFTQFYRASNARALQVDGTGLGLSIVRQTAEAHGGTVRLESVEGEGTTVYVDLPARPV
jgi:two-component system, OmpR family, phosphate regulon sensor histidine kinase PhoR